MIELYLSYEHVSVVLFFAAARGGYSRVVASAAPAKFFALLLVGEVKIVVLVGCG